MSARGPRAATITIGSRLTSGGEGFTVLGIVAERLGSRL